MINLQTNVHNMENTCVQCGVIYWGRSEICLQKQQNYYKIGRCISSLNHLVGVNWLLADFQESQIVVFYFTWCSSFMIYVWNWWLFIYQHVGLCSLCCSQQCNFVPAIVKSISTHQRLICILPDKPVVQASVWFRCRHKRL